MADFDPTVDIRPTIAHGRGYNPTAHQHEPTPFKEFPKWVKTPDGRSLIANNEADEQMILGIKKEPPKAASVDISNLAKPEVVQAASKQRGRPKKAPVDLPPNLE